MKREHTAYQEYILREFVDVKVAGIAKRVFLDTVSNRLLRAGLSVFPGGVGWLVRLYKVKSAGEILFQDSGITDTFETARAHCIKLCAEELEKYRKTPEELAEDEAEAVVSSVATMAAPEFSEEDAKRLGLSDSEEVKP